MVLHWYEYWGIDKWVVLHSDSVQMKPVWVYKGVFHFLNHTYWIIKDNYSCLSSIKVVICCVYLHNLNTLDNLICICVWESITLFTCVVHDAIGSTYNIFDMRVQFYLDLYNGTFIISGTFLLPAWEPYMFSLSVLLKGYIQLWILLLRRFMNCYVSRRYHKMMSD